MLLGFCKVLTKAVSHKCLYNVGAYSIICMETQNNLRSPWISMWCQILILCRHFWLYILAKWIEQCLTKQRQWVASNFNSAEMYQSVKTTLYLNVILESLAMRVYDTIMQNINNQLLLK